MSELQGGRSGGGAPDGGEPVFDEASFDTPNCAVCLHRMQAADGPNGGVYWACASCGATRVA